MSQTKFRSLVLLVAGILLCFPPTNKAEAQTRGISLSMNANQTHLFLLVRFSRFRFRRIAQRRWRAVVRLWARTPVGWKRIGYRSLRRPKYTRALNIRRLCRGYQGRMKVVMQLGIRNGRSWWDRVTRRWTNAFISHRQSHSFVICGNLPGPWPPGSRATPGNIISPNQPVPVQPAPVNPGQPAPVDPNQPDPNQPVTVPNASFLSFQTTMKDASFDKDRYRLVRNWASRLNQMRVSHTQVRLLLNTFSFDSTRAKAAVVLSSHVLRPLKVSEVIHIVKGFSMDRNRLKAAFAYCNNLEDSINIHQLAKVFTMRSDRRRILKGCR